MCVYSMIGDHSRDFLPQKWPDFPWDDIYRKAIYPKKGDPGSQDPTPTVLPTIPAVSKEDFEGLRRDVEQIKDLLKRALKYDEENDEPHCEVDEKVEFLKRLADYLGIDMSEVLPKE